MLNTHVPAKTFHSLSETDLESRGRSHLLEEIRFNNPSLGTVVSYDVDILHFVAFPFARAHTQTHT